MRCECCLRDERVWLYDWRHGVGDFCPSCRARLARDDGPDDGPEAEDREPLWWEVA